MLDGRHRRAGWPHHSASPPTPTAGQCLLCRHRIRPSRVAATAWQSIACRGRPWPGTVVGEVNGHRPADHAVVISERRWPPGRPDGWPPPPRYTGLIAGHRCLDRRPLTRDAPIIGRLSAVLPIIGIGRLLRRYRPSIDYRATSHTDWRLILRWKTVKRYEGSRLRLVESGLWTQFHISRRLRFNCRRVTTLYVSD